MKRLHRKSLLLASSLAALLALGACNRSDDRTVGQQVDSAISKSEQAAERAKEEAKDAAARAKAAMNRATEETKSMGSTGTSDKVDDAAITSKVNAGLAADKDLSAMRIDVDTREGVVTLSGLAPSSTARERAAEIARNVKGVNSVNNKLTLKAG